MTSIDKGPGNNRRGARESRRAVSRRSGESEMDRLEADPKLSVELAAATLTARIDALVSAAVRARPDISRADLAARIGVSEGRVSQVLSGVESPKIVTLARYLRALGYELAISLIPVDQSAPSVISASRMFRRIANVSHVELSIVTDGTTRAPRYTVTPAVLEGNTSTVRGPIRVGSIDFSTAPLAFRDNAALSSRTGNVTQ
ncbi:MAG: transcriptional regulator, Fis family [Planctomycetaceae bacterium]|nr:transcriptional regulator, Fis family [Planctomycetaceae bacterium]